MTEAVRIDKYLWAIRAFKTRSEACDACKGGKIRVDGRDIKPSKEVKVGEVITVRKGPVTYTYKVVALLSSRVGAALVPNYALDLTPESEREILRAPRETVFLSRDKGTGRPTKKERRELDSLMDGLYDDED